jgi:hypothetical protein
MNCIVWMFGRGASIACNLAWAVPQAWLNENRTVLKAKIKAALLGEMARSEINTRPYKALLAELAHRTSPGWQHRFLTTNWDTLLQREIDALPLTRAPEWMPETHVFHLNGAVENLLESDGVCRRSPFLLETDTATDRTSSLEFNQALQFIVWRQAFVVIGMSFSCPTDRAFLAILHSIEDDLPVGFAWWLVINPDSDSAQEVAARIKAALPKALVTYVVMAFEQWVQEGMSQLVAAKILEPIVQS